MRTFISKLLILLGLFCYVFAAYLVYDRTNPNRVSFAYQKQVIPTEEKQAAHAPVRIIIPKISVALPVIPSKIVDGEWESTKEGVSYLSSSPVPGELGNSILYGHNWANLLGNLTKVKPGDTFEIVYDNGTKKTFEVEYTVTVTPDQTHILAPSQDKRITLYTCTGFLDSKRYVVVGILEE